MPKKDDIFMAIFVIIIIIAMLVTFFFSGNKSRHGVGLQKIESPSTHDITELFVINVNGLQLTVAGSMKTFN